MITAPEVVVVLVDTTGGADLAVTWIMAVNNMADRKEAMGPFDEEGS